MTSPCVVILTGGALPAQAQAPPDRADIAVIMAEAAEAPLPLMDDPVAARLRRAAAAGFRHGYQRAAADHRAISVYVVADPAEAALLAQAISREIDPAYVIRAASPLAEALGCYDHARDAADALTPGAEIAGDDPKEASR